MALHLRPEPVFVRRRRVAALVSVAVLGLLAGLGWVVLDGGDPDAPTQVAQVGGPDAGDGGSTDTTDTTVATTTTTTVPPIPSEQTAFALRERLTGDLSPKSVVASPTGLVIANNMMYTHTVAVFSADGQRKGTIDDSVDLAEFGIEGHPGVSKGAPVEGAFTSDGAHAYVSNYSMYGNGFGPEGSDSCTPASGYDDSYLYRIDTATLAIDQVIPVGSVPKYVAVTPDDSRVLVTNWCTWDMTIVDTATGQPTSTVPLDAYPRGIAVSPDSRTAYVALMGADRVVRVDLTSGAVSSFAATGDAPRHIVISPDGGHVYVSNNKSGTVNKVATATGEIVSTVRTGSQPRSMAISPDGTALYVANYDSSTVTKLRTSDMAELAVEATDHHPIGIAYEPTTQTVWVACYGGSILVYDDRAPAG